MFLAAALAAMIGIALGMFGGGGSILTVPVLVYVLGMDAKEAIATSLAVIGATSLLGAVGHWRAGNVNLRVGGIFGAVAMAGTYVGARLAVHFSGEAQLALFAGVMMLAAFFMFRPQRLRAAAEPRQRGIQLGPIVAEGIAVGIVTGLVGAGGGFLIVPALVVLGKVPMKQAVGTSLLVIAMKSAAGFAGYRGQVEVDWTFATLFTAACIVGIVLGTWLLRFVPQHSLQRAFAVFLVVMSGLILYQNLGVVLPGTQVGPPRL